MLWYRFGVGIEWCMKWLFWILGIYYENFGLICYDVRGVVDDCVCGVGNGSYVVWFVWYVVDGCVECWCVG